MRRKALAVRALAFAAGISGLSEGAKQPAKAGQHQHHHGRPPSYPVSADSSVASRAARLTESECLRELARLQIKFDKAGPSPGVLIPVRLLGPISGVAYRTDFPDKQRSKVPFEVFDCRLVVALSAWSETLVAHGISEVRIFSAWRPPSASFPAGKIATAHPGALATDIRVFKRGKRGEREGESLDVEADFHGQIGSIACGKGARPPEPDTPRARELRTIYCAAVEAHLFHLLLSPNHDRAHRNHFHVEVRPAVRWFIVE
jgi:hypothetical protein